MEETLWSRVKSGIKTAMPAHSYRMWIEPLGLESMDEETVVLECANRFSKKRVQEHYSDLIRDALGAETGRELTLRFAVREGSVVASASPRARTPKRIIESAQMELPQVAPKLMNNRMLRRQFTFDRFVVGNNNDFAYTAALSLAAQQNGYNNSLFMFADTGMGKSHLSQAVGHQILRQRPNERVYYVTAEDFTNEMVNALRSGQIDTFKEKYRTQCDVLLMEDVHFLTGKEGTQRELAMTLDYLFEADRKIIFSGATSPTDIPKLNEQLRSRFSSGLISKIDRPNFATRMKILQQRCREERCEMPMGVIEYLAGELDENIRQLESGLIGVAAKHSLLGSTMDLDLAQSVVSTIVRDRKRISVEAIKGLVCKEFGVSPEEIMSKSRKQAVVRPRQLAIYLSRKYTDQSIQSIGRSFNRYHATAIHAINTVDKGIRERNQFARQFERLSQKIEHGDF